VELVTDFLLEGYHCAQLGTVDTKIVAENIII